MVYPESMARRKVNGGSVVIKVPLDVKAEMDSRKSGDESYGSFIRRLLGMPEKKNGA